MRTLYCGSVKDLVGPFKIGQYPAVAFEYTDAYSVFDWGRMPDLLTGKGEALAVMAAEIFEKLEKPETWREYSKTPDALSLRKGNRFGSLFNEMGEELQARGLRTHYLGALEKSPLQVEPLPKTTDLLQGPARRIAVQQVTVEKPLIRGVLGRAVPDYTGTRKSALPRLIPIELVFRFGVPEGSSLLERVAKNPEYLATLGISGGGSDILIEPGVKWDFPLLECFTKLEPSDRILSLSEALAISGISHQSMEEMMLKTVWIAGLLRHWFGRLGLQLADGKLEWAIGADGKCLLVDAIGPDELRILKDGVQLSKEFLRIHYRKTPWFGMLERAKQQAKKLGSLEWKRWVPEAPPHLPPAHHELATQVYLSLANDLLGKKWFSQAWGVNRVVEGLKNLAQLESGEKN